MHGKGYSFPLPGSSKKAGPEAAAQRETVAGPMTTAAHGKQASEYKDAKQQSNAIMRARFSHRLWWSCGAED